MTSILNADLHCHSVVSDGTLTPEELAARAAANGVELWALTDHDEVGGQERAAAAAKACGIRYLCGVEISVTFLNQTVHIVGLGVDPDNIALREGLTATRGGRTLNLRGQCPQNLDDASDLGSPDPVQQTQKVMQNIKQLIEEAGGEMQHLVKVVVYLTDVRHREAVYRTMGEYIKGVHPVSTGLVVSALARPSWLVEIDGTAVIPD